MWLKMLCLKLVVAVLALFHHVTAQTVDLISSEGATLQERSTPYEICVDLSGSPSGGDLTVSVTSVETSATSPEDFQLSSNMLTFVDGTADLQQCFNLTVVDDNLLEQTEFFSLMATASSGTTDSLLLFISNNDNALIGLDRESYTVNEADGSVTVCVLFLMNSGVQDPTLSVEATLSVADGTAIAVEDYGQPLPTNIELTSTTPASGECSTINIPQDAIEEGREMFSVTVTAGARAQVVDGRGTAQVLIVDGCGSLSPPENGNVDASITTVGSVATYSCNSGFLISDDSQRNCQMDGFWSGSAPTCLAICEDLTDPTSGTVSISDPSRLPGTLATYTCNAGYLLSGDSQRTCQGSGMWSGAAPVCNQVTCEELTNPLNGEVLINDSSRVVGSTATYTCRTGFLLNGSSRRDCQENGVWTGAAPLCIQLPPTGPVSGNQNRNIGIGVGVGVGGFLLILVVVIVIAVLILALKKRNTEKYVLNYSTVYGSGVGGTGNDYSTAPSSKPDGGESGSNGVNERGVDVGEDEGDEEINAITFKEE